MYAEETYPFAWLPPEVPPPLNLDAEGAVLSACFMEHDGRALDLSRSILQPADYYSDSNRIIFQTLCDLQDEGKPWDIVTVASRLRANGHLQRVGGTTYLSVLIDATPYYFHVLDHAQIVKDKSRLRQLLHLVRAVPGMLTEIDKPGAVQTLFDDLQVRLSDLSQLDAPKYLRPVSEVLSEVNTQVVAAKNSESHVIGIPTGFDVDTYTGGLHDSNLRIVAARPGMGKSAWALSEAYNIAKKGYAVAMFSLEMPAIQLGMRLVSMDSQFTVSDLRAGRITDEQWPHYTEALARLKELPIFIDDNAALTTFELRARVKRWKSEINNDRYLNVTKKRVGAVYVDYLQLMKPARPSGSREVDVSSISRELKESAKQLNVPITAMAQLNREVEKGADKRPQLHHLRESGSVEADADDILLLYRPEYYVRKGEDVDSTIQGLCEVIVAKQRNGAPGMQKMTFVAEHMRFANRASAEYDFNEFDNDYH